MFLYIRNNPRPINFCNNIDELRSLIESYIPNRPILLGDISFYHKNSVNLLLKFLEDNPSVDCYSSLDITNPILLSRFVKVVKEPLGIKQSLDSDAFFESSRGYLEAERYLSMLSDKSKLLVKSVPTSVLKVLQSL